MTKAEELAHKVRGMRASELLSPKLVEVIQQTIDEAIDEGRAMQAILELQGRRRFIEDLRQQHPSL